MHLATVEVDKPLGDRWLMALLFQKSGVSTERFFDAYSNACCLDTSGDVIMYSDKARAEGDSWAGEIRLDGTFNAFGREHAFCSASSTRSATTTSRSATPISAPRQSVQPRVPGRQSCMPGGAGYQNFDFDFSNENLDRGLYGQLILTVSDRARVLLGARFDHSQTSIISTTTLACSTPRSDDEWTMRRRHDLRASASTSRPMACIAQTFNPTVDARSESGRILDPETGEGLEFGLKTEWFDAPPRRIAGRVPSRARQHPDHRSHQPQFQHQRRVAAHRRRGARSVRRRGGGTHGGAAWAWLDSEYVDPRDENFGSQPCGIIERQAVRVRELQAAERAAAAASASACRTSTWGSGSSRQSVPERLRAAGRQFYYNTLERWQLSLQVRNVGDERYIERLRDQYQDNFFGAPRALLLRSEHRF